MSGYRQPPLKNEALEKNRQPPRAPPRHSGSGDGEKEGHRDRGVYTYSGAGRTLALGLVPPRRCAWTESVLWDGATAGGKARVGMWADKAGSTKKPGPSSSAPSSAPRLDSMPAS
jgi:hypothetical protein